MLVILLVLDELRISRKINYKLGLCKLMTNYEVNH